MCVNNSFEYTFYFVNSVDRDESFVDDLIHNRVLYAFESPCCDEMLRFSPR